MYIKYMCILYIYIYIVIVICGVHIYIYIYIMCSNCSNGLNSQLLEDVSKQETPPTTSLATYEYVSRLRSLEMSGGL